METIPNKPVFTGKEGGEIDHETAISWTKNFRDKHPGETISHFFGREILEKLLAQKDCVGLRFFHAHDHQGKKHLVIVGTGGDGNDLTSKSAGHMMADQSYPCPGGPGCQTSALSGK